MYVSIREDILKAAEYKSIAEGLKDLGLDSVEVEFFRNYTVYETGSWEKLQFTRDNAATVIAGAFGSAAFKSARCTGALPTARINNTTTAAIIRSVIFSLTFMAPSANGCLSAKPLRCPC